MIEDQRGLTNEEAEREFKAAEEEFKEELEGSDIVDITEQAEPTKEETAKKYQDILIALGFIHYDNKEKGVACKLKVGQLLIGRTFTEKHPIGNMWVQCLSDCEHGKKGDFLKRDECKLIPQVALFYRIRDGELPIPEPTITGEIVGKSEKAIQIQFEEFGENRIETWGFGALKKDTEGVFYIPASYSKETEKYNPKMQAPRNIILENYEVELEKAPLMQTSTTEEKKEQPKEKIESGTVADKIPHKEPESREETIANKMKLYLEKGREMVEQIFPELEQPQLSELSQDIATSMFIEDRKEARKERY